MKRLMLSLLMLALVAPGTISKAASQATDDEEQLTQEIQTLKEKVRIRQEKLRQKKAAKQQAEQDALSEDVQPTALTPVAPSHVERTSYVPRTSHDSSIWLAPTVGMTLFTIEGDDVSGAKTDIGLAIGGTVDIGTGGVLFHTGLEYLNIGPKAEGSQTVHFGFDYLAIPVAAKVFFGESRNSMFFQGGISPAILLGAKAHAGSESLDLKSNMSSFDLLASVGLGGQFKVNSDQALIIEGSFSRGLLNIAKDSEGSAFNQGFMILTSYSIAID